MINERYEFDLEIRKKYNVSLVSGSDEVGRGCLAGPLVVATVILKDNYSNPLIKDSKLLSEKNRELLFEEIKENCLDYSINIYDSTTVDQLNPKATSILGMKEGIISLKTVPEICLIDGEKVDIDGFNCIKLIKGDNLSQTIAAASILAKVTRDRIMQEYAKQYPEYGFEKHKGYWTKLHQEMTAKYGVLSIHRKSYKPIAELLLQRR